MLFLYTDVPLKQAITTWSSQYENKLSLLKGKCFRSGNFVLGMNYVNEYGTWSKHKLHVFNSMPQETLISVD